ncbi:hypothetical protein BH23PLA1_BH23PLA1_03840 [soil metagenome]
MMRHLPCCLSIAASAFLCFVIPFANVVRAQDQDPNPNPKLQRQEPDDRGRPGQFFTVDQPIRGDRVESIKASTRALIQAHSQRGQEPVIVFDIRPGSSEFSTCYELAEFISTRLGGARKTIAYVPEPLSGFAVFVALACDEIVLGEQAALGPIGPTGAAVNRIQVTFAEELANRKGRDADLIVGMLDRQADLRKVRTATGETEYVLAADLQEYKQFAQVVDDRPAWDAGSRGVLTAQRARDEGFVELLARDRAEVARAYGITGLSNDPTLGADEINPIWIRVDRAIDVTQESYLRRRIAQARREGINLIFFEFDTEGGLDGPADSVAELIDSLDEIRTVAYVHERALGVSALMVLACDEIVFHNGATMGDVRQIVTGRGRVEDLTERKAEQLAEKAASLARRNGHPAAVARAMVDPLTVIIQALDKQVGAVVLVSRQEIQAEPDRFVEQGTLYNDPGSVLTIVARSDPRSNEARIFGLSNQVVSNTEEFKDLYALRGQAIQISGPTWVDTLVTTLNTPWMSGMLLFVGLFMLILEMKLPGIGLPAITATLAFLLFFWSRYLGGTADALEIILFLVGLVCLALELFVFPGFGVFGMSGVVLVLVSVVMASHTFVWPTQDSQYREMGQTLLQLVLSLIGVIAAAILVGRYFPSMPLFNRLILRPDTYAEGTADPTAKPSLEGDAPLFYLLGETGRTTSVLRPTGKARFGEELIDVTADGFYIEPDRLVQVVEVQGARVIVKKVN